jgi:hypothetical protein
MFEITTKLCLKVNLNKVILLRMNDKKFFDKKSSEEENPVEIDSDLQRKYMKINQIYEEFFEEGCIAEAKVRFY